jgi:hypothetical protein
MANAIAPRRPQSRPVASVHRALDLASLHGEVHRFSGVVDRFGSYDDRGSTVRTICIRELRLDATGQHLQPEHWWFRLREVWSEAGVRVGDTVIFTAKVQRCTKGWEDPGTSGSHGVTRRNTRSREQVMGFGTSPRTVSVVRRRQGVNHQLAELEQQLERAKAALDLSHDELSRTQVHRDAALQTTTALQQDLSHSRSQLQRVHRRAGQACALLLCLGGLGGFAAGWSGTHWKQAQVTAPVPLMSTLRHP